jgi:hypothetical protein
MDGGISMKKRYVLAGVLGSIAAGAVVYKKVKDKKDSKVILYPICRVTMHLDYPISKLDKLVKKADIIVNGIIEEISSPRWNNKDNVEPKNISSKDVIYKDYYIRVLKVLKGNIEVDGTVKLRSFEGEIGGFTVEDNSQIVLENGQEVIAFLTRDSSNISRDKVQDYYIPVGAKQGVYTLEEDVISNINEELDIDVFNEQIEELLKNK